MTKYKRSKRESTSKLDIIEHEYEEEKEEIDLGIEKKDLKKEKKSFIYKIPYILLILVLFFLYARFIGTKGLSVNEYDLKLNGLPESFDGFKIVHFSDMDLGSTFYIDSLDKVVNKINGFNPDIVVFTGDMFYNIDEKSVKTLEKELKKIDPLIGKYLVRGDKDVKNAYFDEIVNNSGFIDLTNSNELIYYKGVEPIGLYGLDSLNKGKQDLSKTFNNSASFRILLAHEPDTIKKTMEYNINLMLSGHSHNNEINIPVVNRFLSLKGAKKYFNESYIVGNTNLYISGGLGTEKTFTRFLNKPSINVYTFVS